MIESHDSAGILESAQVRTFPLCWYEGHRWREVVWVSLISRY